MRTVVFSLLLVVVVACKPPGYDKGDDAPAIDAGPTKQPDAASVDAPQATTCEKTFRLEGQGSASSVWLTGNFVAWGGNPGAGAVELVKGADQVWTVTRTMNAGEHHYKFIVDSSNWIADPGNPNFVDDGFGGRNSVYSCSP
ncbi:MAG TPA: glycogen-binding domain-containing protein [Kofleriaceae bacterium]|nr:glycogen-binding domain-containing protein [Kofleriaceae bacterium]